MRQTDIPALIPLAQRIWRAHYPSIITPEQIEYMLAQRYTAQALEAALQKDERFMLALQGDAIVGFASATALTNITNEILRGANSKGWFMNKCYVAPEFHSRGVGGGLLKALEDALTPTRMRLQVARANTKAWNFYQKQGFTIEQEYDFPIGHDYYMCDYVMEKRYE